MKNHKSIQEIKERLLDDIGDKTLAHSIRVGETAVKLSKKYNLDKEKVYLAGLLHDCGRLEDCQDLLKYASDFGIILDDIAIHNTQLIHAYLGARMAQALYGVEDLEILDSIKYHTTGRENMGLLEKIIFISDYIEPARSFKGLEEVRNLAPYDLDKSIIMSMEESIKFLIDKDKLIHLDTIKALNYLKLKNMKRGDKHIE